MLRNRSRTATADDRPGPVWPVTEANDVAWLLNAKPLAEPPPPALTAGVTADDAELVHRVCAAYRLAEEQYRSTDSFWDQSFRELKRDVHEALAGADRERAAAVLRNPAETTHFWGFDAVSKAPPDQVEPHELVLRRLDPTTDWRQLYALWVMDGLQSLASAVGARDLVYPEMAPDAVGHRYRASWTPDQLVEDIETALDVEVHFPNPFPGELGLATRRGVVGMRSVQSLYQAWRIAEIADRDPGFRVVEIGAGLGRTAYFADLFGITDYTVVDIPLTNAAQGYFLGRTLGPHAVRLHGESSGGTRRIVPPEAMAEVGDGADLLVTVDSLTELDRETAERYVEFSRLRTTRLLSINHEANAFTARSLFDRHGDCRVTRFPYWVRRGYVEELVEWRV